MEECEYTLEDFQIWKVNSLRGVFLQSRIIFGVNDQNLAALS